MSPPTETQKFIVLLLLVGAFGYGALVKGSLLLGVWLACSLYGLFLLWRLVLAVERLPGNQEWNRSP